MSSEVVLDLFSGWTKEDLSLLVSLGSDSNKKRSESLKAHINSLSPQERKNWVNRSFLSKKSREKALANSYFRKPGVQDYLTERKRLMHANMTEEERKEWVARSFHNKEARIKAEEGKRRFWEDPAGEVTRRIISNFQRTFWASMDEEEKKRRMQANIHNPKFREGIGRKISLGIRASEPARGEAISRGLVEYWRSLTLEERKEKSHINSKVQKNLWANMTPEELKSRQVQLPSVPEGALERYLNRNFPGRIGYNGDGRLGINIGGKIPDFVYLDGNKKVIEVLGGVGYYHFLEDEELKKAHYKEYGYECIVIWEWDCYDPEGLDKIFT